MGVSCINNVNSCFNWNSEGVAQSFYHWICPVSETEQKVEDLVGRITPKDAKKISLELVEEVLGEEHERLKEVLGKLDTEALLKQSGLTESEAKEIMETQSSLKEVALKNVVTEKALSWWRQLGPEMVAFCHHLLGLMITLLALDGSFDNDSRSKYNRSSPLEAQAILTTYLQILAYPSTVYLFVFALTQVILPALAITAGVVLLTVALLVLYNKYLRPTPRDCEGLDNLTQRQLEVDANPILPRKEILDKIEKSFESGKAVLLVGDSGTGKSSIVTTLAARINNSESIPLIKGALVFSANTSNLSNEGEGPSLEHIRKRYRYHTRNAIFFFDEIHAAMKPTRTGKTHEDSILTFCDQFPYTIGATTTRQYNQYIKGKVPFERRFTVINVEPLERSDVESALYDILNKKNPELLFESDVIPYICAKTKGIDDASALLYRAIAAASRPVFESEEASLEEMNKQVRSMELKLQFENGALLQENRDRYKALKAERDAIQADLDQKKDKLKKIQGIEKEYLAKKRESYFTAERGDLNEWLQNQTYQRVLMEKIEKQRQGLGLSGRLDRKLIDSF